MNEAFKWSYRELIVELSLSVSLHGSSSGGVSAEGGFSFTTLRSGMVAGSGGKSTDSDSNGPVGVEDIVGAVAV